MVHHIGIDPLNGKAVIFDTIANTIKKVDIQKVTSNDIGNIDGMFSSIKDHFSGDIGNTCACIDEKYGNDIRFEFFKHAAKNGFHHFEIIDINTALYLHAISHKSEFIDSFWILWSKKCYQFLIENDKTFFVKAFSVSTKKEKDIAKKMKPPQALFLPLAQSENVAKEFCSPSKFYFFSNFEIEIAALKKAKLIGREKEAASKITSNFGRKCEILFNEKSLLTVLPEDHIPYEKIIKVEKKGEENTFLKIIENDLYFKTFIFDKEILMFYINSNGIYYLSEVNEFEKLQQNKIDNAEKKQLTDDFGSKTQLPDSTEKKKPQLPTTAKPGFNAMLSNIGISEQFQSYADLIRQIGFFQSQISIVQTLISLKYFLLSTKSDTKYAEIEPIILYLEAFFEDLRKQCQIFIENNEKYGEKIDTVLNAIISPLNNLRLTFEKNKKAWPYLFQYNDECNAETAWIESTLNNLSNWKSVDSQNCKDFLQFHLKLASDVSEHKEKMKKLEEKYEKLNEMVKNDIFEIFFIEVDGKWKSFQEKFDAFSISVENIQRAVDCIDKVEEIFQEKRKTIYDYFYETNQTTKNISEHETYFKEMKTYSIDIRNVKKEIDGIQKSFEVKNSSIDSTMLSTELQKNKNNLITLFDLINDGIKKEEELIKRYHEFDAEYEVLKMWITESCSFFSVEENDKTTELLNEKFLKIKNSMETKEKEIEALKEKSEKMEIEGFPEINRKFSEIQDDWKNFLKLISERNSEKNRQNFDSSNNLLADRQHLSPRRSNRNSSILDESFRSFWQNRRPQSFQAANDKAFDDNWLKRMSKISNFDSPPKYKTFDTNINCIGIDLGTSSCCVAVNRKDRIEAAGIDNTGERTLPSYVGFDESVPKCGKVVVDHFGTFSKSTIFDSKRIIGKSFEEIIIDPTWLFDVIEEDETVKLQVHGPKDTVIKKTPEEIASILLLYMKQKAEEFQGKPVTNVVVTIPAAFTESQKEATLKAAELAGFDKVNLLPEPVAASFAYFIDRSLPNNSYILLFDLGGGTLDICIFEIKNFAFKIIRNTGDANIGGRNFDQLLFNYFNNELLSRHGVDVEKNERRKYKLMLKCQDIKHSLSARNDDGINVDDYDTSKDEVLPIKITREQFEEMSMDLINVIEILLKYATDGMQDKIEKVLHVGGSSRMPLIKSMLETMFPNAEQCCEKHPEEVVAVGAAYYSYHLAYNQ